MRFKLVVSLLMFFSQQIWAADENRGQPGFFLTLPPVLTNGRNANACLLLRNIVLPVKGIVKLEINSTSHVLAERTFEKEYSCFQLQVPSTETSTATVEIQIQANDVLLSGRSSNTISILSPNGKQEVTFLQTDRQMYKPGDVLKIRALVVNKEFLAGEEQKIPTIKITNPDDVTVVVWNNVSTVQGLVHLEYQLSDETVEGQWTIEANGETKTVEIKKYVLPRFKVELLYPKEVYEKAKKVEFKVCAKYSYGQPVKGVAKLNVSREQPYWLTEKIGKVVLRTKELESGCANFILASEDIILKGHDYWWMPIQITANVTEAGTEQTEHSKGEISVTRQSLELEIISKDDTLRTGLPYEAEVKIKNAQDVLQNQTIQICYDPIDSREGWTYHQTVCSNFSIHPEDSLRFTIPPFGQNITQLNIRANCCGDAWGYKYLTRSLSASGNYIYFNQDKSDSAKCYKTQHFTVHYTVKQANLQDNFKFYYMVIPNNKNYLVDEVIVQPRAVETFKEDTLRNLITAPNNYTDYSFKVAKFNFSFELDRKILSKYKLLLYTLLPSGEIVAATKEIELEPCLPNEVDIEWSKQELKPGEEANLSIKTSPKSLCSVSAVDEATKFRSNDNFNIRTLVERLAETDFPYYYYYNDRWSCENQSSHNYESGYVWQPEIYSDTDTYMTLVDSGVFVVTNFKVPRRPCVKREVRYWAELASSSVDLRVTDEVNTSYNEVSFISTTSHGAGIPAPPGKEMTERVAAPIRSFFPETWLWELVPTDFNGEAKLVRNVPHSITNWVSNAICVSPTDGVGLSDTKSLITFQPFFIDVITPYSIKRGEILHLVIKAFNYLNHSLPIQVTILQQGGLEILDESNGITRCVESSDGVDFVFRIRSTVIGKLNITVIGEVDSSAAETCGSQSSLERRDVVRKTLLVEPEGFPVEVVKSALLCANDSHPNEAVWTLELPQSANVVPDSAKSRVIFNSDILGSTLENLERLLVIPTGCGEQVMSKLAPNLHVLRYLNATNRLTDEIKNRAVENIKIGYQKILTYKHKDGSFSAFGEQDGEGSMFLTAFVVRTLTEAKPYIFIDDGILSKSVGWILEHQTQNGSFPPLNHLFQHLGDESEAAAVVTSYVLISLKEANIEIPDGAQSKAISFISSYSGNNTYPLALISYALYLTDKQTEGKMRLSALMEKLASTKQNKDDGYYSYYSSKDIEIYGYALLSFLKQNNTLQASTLVQWLSKKMSPRGGYASTQDTVVALDALSKYSTIIREKPNISVHFAASGQEQELAISDEDQIKVNTFNLKQAADTVHLKVSGKGCVLAQAVLTYNVYSLTETPAFAVTVEPQTNSGKQRCVDAIIKACAAYNTPDVESNMVVMEIGVPSGYHADEESLSKVLSQDSNNKIRRYEQERDNIVLYFAGLTDEKVCASFNLVESQKVENRTASTVNIFDYYKPESRASVLYELNECQ